MRTLPPTIESIVEEQALRWRLQREGRRHEQQLLPVVTISRQHGAGGSEVAQRLCGELGYDLFDRQLIQEIAHSAHLSEQIVQTLDEKNRESLTEWLLSIGSPTHLSGAGYLEHLTRVVGTIARHGGAVILGRGAHLILGPGEALRVLVVAPLASRVAAVMRREGLSEQDAGHRVQDVEAERQAYLERHFHADAADLAKFDLAVNTAEIGVEGAVAAIRAALASLPPRWSAS